MCVDKHNRTMIGSDALEKMERERERAVEQGEIALKL